MVRAGALLPAGGPAREEGAGHGGHRRKAPPRHEGGGAQEGDQDRGDVHRCGGNLRRRGRGARYRDRHPDHHRPGVDGTCRQPGDRKGARQPGRCRDAHPDTPAGEVPPYDIRRLHGPGGAGAQGCEGERLHPEPRLRYRNRRHHTRRPPRDREEGCER